MKHSRLFQWSRLVCSGALLFGLGGCLGPNPGFFVSTSAANAAISSLVKALLDNLLASTGG